MWRIWVRGAAIGLTALVAVPPQWLSLRFNLPMLRWIPLYWHRSVLRLVGVRIIVHGRPAEGLPLLIVSNHISWLDIPVIGTQRPLSFVAKSEIAGWPLFGFMAKLQRSIFVDRDRRHSTGDSAAEIGARLADGDPVVLFAEGTTSDGNRVLPFRSALVGAARHALEAAGTDAEGHMWVQPLAVAYTRLHGLPMGRTHRPVAAWAGSVELVPHLTGVLRHGAIDAVLVWGDPVRVDHATDRKALTRDLERVVRRLAADARHGRRADQA
jgi:1-acyl-sn-glycerol-3-phosphate acyltransferase